MGLLGYGELFLEKLQEVMDTRSELKREMRDREEGNAKAGPPPNLGVAPN